MKHPQLNLKGSRVLVVDDVAENRKILTQTLELADYKVSAAPNGEVALKVAAKSLPDLILLDLLMPGMNGFEVCRALKANEETASVPVIFITANSETESVLEGFRLGAVDFISKPFKTEEVLVRAETHIKLHVMARELRNQNRELGELNAQLRAEMSMRRQAEHNLSVIVEGQQETFHTSGTLRHDARCYVERPADRNLIKGLMSGEFCYVLTARQMGKSSLMARTANRLREAAIHVATIDLTALGQNLTLEQWYDGLLSRIGRRLGLEEELDDFWLEQTRLNPVQRFFAALRDVVLTKCTGQLVLFVDELDVVRSLPFSTDEFFGAIRECYNRRTEDEVFNRLTFCLLGVATPSDLIADSRATPFNIGTRIPLEDFRLEDSQPFQQGLEMGGFRREESESVLSRVFHWTNGHPYLTQRLCRALVDFRAQGNEETDAGPDLVDELTEKIFLSTRAGDRDDNLIFVRERMLRSHVNVDELFGICEKIVAGENVADDDENAEINQLHLAGISRVENGCLRIRNRIYEHVFDRAWIQARRVGLGCERGNLTVK